MLSRLINRWYWILVMALLMLGGLFVPAEAQGTCVMRVNPFAHGAGDGSTWDDAFTGLQAGIDAAAAAAAGGYGSCEVWVLQGIYTPSNNRGDSFVMRNGVAIYGGFGGSEVVRSERDWVYNQTVLSGDIGAVDDSTDNSYHVVNNANIDETAVLDGFTISGAQGDAGSYLNNSGGGMRNTSHASPTLANIIFADNHTGYGGGLYNLDYSSPTLTNVVFSGNSVDYYGGGIFNETNSAPALNNVTFNGNSALRGGGIFNSTYCVSQVNNSILWGNTAIDAGPNVYNLPEATNPGSAIFTNSLIGGCGGSGAWNAACGTDSGNNLAVDPQFVDAGSGNLHLAWDSPAVGAGSNALLPADERDLDGDGNATEPLPYDAERKPRVSQGNVDMGAYELRVIFVDDDALGANNGSSWDDAYTDLRDALVTASSGDEIWTAEGTYYPSASGDPEMSFEMKDGVAVYGGFLGSETSRAQRAGSANATILSGDLGTGGDPDDNSATVVLAVGVGETAVLDGFTISGAYGAFNFGGGMGNFNSSPTLANLTFTGNTAYFGGGMYNESSSPTLTNVTFSENSAYYGAGMNNMMSNPVLNGAQLTHNTSHNTGGAMFNSASEPIITDSDFIENEADSDGGGIYNDTDSQVTLTRVRFLDNKAVNGSGGAIYNNDTLTNALVNVLFSGNSAYADGGAIFNITASYTLANVTFIGNTSAHGSGGGFWTAGGDLAINNTTFTGNTAGEGAGGGIWNVSGTSSPQVRNSILWGNSAASGANVFNEEGALLPVFTYSLVEGCSGWSAATCGTNGGNNLFSNPLFVNAASGNVRLAYASPARNAGSNSLLPQDAADLDGDGSTTEPLPFDQGGSPRVFGASVDMGAFEVPLSIAEGDGPLAYTILEETSLNRTLHADTSGGGAAVWSISSPASRGTASINAAGAFTYTPNANENGADSFTVQVEYGGMVDTVVVNVSITPVNDPPSLAAIGGKAVNEGSALTFTATATDPLDTPPNTLAFTLDSGAPDGASIHPTTGVFTWTPSEAQGPGSYSITVRVTDNGTPALDDFETITVTVAESNTAPVLAAIGDKIVSAGALLTFTAAATDADRPANTLIFTLDSGAPDGASIHPTTGVFTWTPTEAQGPGNYSINIRVTDNGTPALDDFETITVSVLAQGSNTAPVLAAIGNKPVFEDTTLAFTATATDAEQPTNTLTFTLDPGAPTGASITSGGYFTWTPTEAQGPGNYPITVRVTDSGAPALDDFETIIVSVTESNTAPVLAPIGSKTINEGSALTFTAAASDAADIPANTLTFSLDSGAPTGASIHPTTGVFTWTPTEAQGPGTYPITVRVTDSGIPPASDFEIIQVTVKAVNNLGLALCAAPNPVKPGGVVVFTLTASNPNPDAGSGLAFTSTLPAGLTFQSSGSSAGCSAVGQQVTCTAASIPANGTLQVTVAASLGAGIKGGDTLSVTAHLAANETDSSTTNNQASVAVKVDWMKVFMPYLGK